MFGKVNKKVTHRLVFYNLFKAKKTRDTVPHTLLKSPALVYKMTG